MASRKTPCGPPLLAAVGRSGLWVALASAAQNTRGCRRAINETSSPKDDMAKNNVQQQYKEFSPLPLVSVTQASLSVSAMGKLSHNLGQAIWSTTFLEH